LESRLNDRKNLHVSREIDKTGKHGPHRRRLQVWPPRRPARAENDRDFRTVLVCAAIDDGAD
jgi:hypothetical protein